MTTESFFVPSLMWATAPGPLFKRDDDLIFLPGPARPPEVDELYLRDFILHVEPLVLFVQMCGFEVESVSGQLGGKSALELTSGGAALASDSQNPAVDYFEIRILRGQARAQWPETSPWVSPFVPGESSDDNEIPPSGAGLTVETIDQTRQTLRCQRFDSVQLQFLLYSIVSQVDSSGNNVFRFHPGATDYCPWPTAVPFFEPEAWRPAADAPPVPLDQLSLLHDIWLASQSPDDSSGMLFGELENTTPLRRQVDAIESEAQRKLELGLWGLLYSEARGSGVPGGRDPTDLCFVSCSRVLMDLTTAGILVWDPPPSPAHSTPADLWERVHEILSEGVNSDEDFSTLLGYAEFGAHRTSPEVDIQVADVIVSFLRSDHPLMPFEPRHDTALRAVVLLLSRSGPTTSEPRAAMIGRLSTAFELVADQRDPADFSVFDPAASGLLEVTGRSDVNAETHDLACRMALMQVGQGLSTAAVEACVRALSPRVAALSPGWFLLYPNRSPEEAPAGEADGEGSVGVVRDPTTGRYPIPDPFIGDYRALCLAYHRISDPALRDETERLLRDKLGTFPLSGLSAAGVIQQVDGATDPLGWWLSHQEQDRPPEEDTFGAHVERAMGWAWNEVRESDPVLPTRRKVQEYIRIQHGLGQVAHGSKQDLAAVFDFDRCNEVLEELSSDSGWGSHIRDVAQEVSLLAFLKALESGSGGQEQYRDLGIGGPVLKRILDLATEVLLSDAATHYSGLVLAAMESPPGAPLEDVDQPIGVKRLDAELHAATVLTGAVRRAYATDEILDAAEIHRSAALLISGLLHVGDAEELAESDPAKFDELFGKIEPIFSYNDPDPVTDDVIFWFRRVRTGAGSARKFVAACMYPPEDRSSLSEVFWVKFAASEDARSALNRSRVMAVVAGVGLATGAVSLVVDVYESPGSWSDLSEEKQVSIARHGGQALEGGLWLVAWRAEMRGATVWPSGLRTMSKLAGRGVYFLQAIAYGAMAIDLYEEGYTWTAAAAALVSLGSLALMSGLLTPGAQWVVGVALLILMIAVWYGAYDYEPDWRRTGEVLRSYGILLDDHPPVVIMLKSGAQTPAQFPLPERHVRLGETASPTSYWGTSCEGPPVGGYLWVNAGRSKRRALGLWLGEESNRWPGSGAFVRTVNPSPQAIYRRSGATYERLMLSPTERAMCLQVGTIDLTSIWDHELRVPSGLVGTAQYLVRHGLETVAGFPLIIFTPSEYNGIAPLVGPWWSPESFTLGPWAPDEAPASIIVRAPLGGVFHRLPEDVLAPIDDTIGPSPVKGGEELVGGDVLGLISRGR